MFHVSNCMSYMCIRVGALCNGVILWLDIWLSAINKNLLACVCVCVCVPRSALLTLLEHRTTPWLQSLSWLLCPSPLKSHVLPVDKFAKGSQTLKQWFYLQELLSLWVLTFLCWPVCGWPPGGWGSSFAPCLSGSSMCDRKRAVRLSQLAQTLGSNWPGT